MQVISILNRYATVHFEGDQAQTFLQGQLTCDLLTLPPQRWCFFGYCNHKGRVLATGYLYCENLQTYDLIMHQGLIQSLHPRLQRSAQLSGVSAALGKNPTLCTIETAPDHALKDLSATYALCLSSETTHDPSAAQDWHYTELAQRLPMIQPETTDQYTPHMLSLPEVILQNMPAVSFEKGCYVGQEIVSRTHHKGQSKRTFTLQTCETLITETVPLPLHDTHHSPCGQVIQQASKGHVTLLGCITRAQPHWIHTAEGTMPLKTI